MASEVKEVFSPYDTADYLQTEEHIEAYLDAVAETGDAAHIVAALGTVARARNMSALAREIGISREGLYKALSAEGNPSFATVMKLVRSLGFQMSFQRVQG